jgi:hypothetical protein
VETLDQLSEARAAGAINVLLDNFTLERMREAVVLAAARALHKVSGGVTMEHLREIAATGVDRISIGALTKAVRGRLLDAGLVTARGRGPGLGCDPGDPPRHLPGSGFVRPAAQSLHRTEGGSVPFARRSWTCKSLAPPIVASLPCCHR